MDSSQVYLVQTDTTVGFSSSDDEKLTTIKNRAKNKKILQTVSNFKILKNKIRIPKKYKRYIRKSKKTTFIYPKGESFRVISKESKFYEFIKKFDIMYSTSANMTSKKFDKEFAFLNSEIIVEDKYSFEEIKASSIIKLSKKHKKNIRI